MKAARVRNMLAGEGSWFVGWGIPLTRPQRTSEIIGGEGDVRATTRKGAQRFRECRGTGNGERAVESVTSVIPLRW